MVNVAWDLLSTFFSSIYSRGTSERGTQRKVSLRNGKQRRHEEHEGLYFYNQSKLTTVSSTEVYNLVVVNSHNQAEV